jgi:hypothetical protein
MKSYKLVDLKDFENISWSFISEGNGRGSKVLHSYLDGSKNLLSIPGYSSAYFFPFIDKYFLEKNKKICEKFFYHFQSIFDSRKNPGSETLNTLGENKKKFIKVDKDIFKKKFLEYLSIKGSDKKSIFKAIHYAYFSACKKKFKNHIILSHVHVFKYFDKYIYKYFPDSKIITLTSAPAINFLRREKDSILRPNFEKFFYTDFISTTIFSFFQTCEFMILGHQSLKNFKQVRLVKFEDIKTNNNKITKSILNYLNLGYSNINKYMTYDNIKWNYSWYNDLLESKKMIIFNNLVKNNLTFKHGEKKIINLIFFNFNKKYKYPNQETSKIEKMYLILKIIFPFQIELTHFFNFYKIKSIKKFIIETFYEAQKIDKILNKYYGNNLFYTKKWTSSYFNLENKYLFIFYLKIKKNNFFKNFLYKIIQIYYFISKIIFLLLSPLIFIKFYIKRIFLFYKFIIKDKFNLNYYPILITKK